MPESGLIDSLVTLLIAVILLYVGFAILYPINPLVAILFVILALYIVVRFASKGKGGL
jgi:4-hydroxybenzoate polyprenyltransferase